MGGVTDERATLKQGSEIYSVVLSLAADGLHFQVLNIQRSTRTAAQIADDLAVVAAEIRKGCGLLTKGAGQSVSGTLHSIR